MITIARYDRFNKYSEGKGWVSSNGVYIGICTLNLTGEWVFQTSLTHGLTPTQLRNVADELTKMEANTTTSTTKPQLNHN